MHFPGQEAHIQFVGRIFRAVPTLAPLTEVLNHRREIARGLCKMVLDHPARAGFASLDHARVLELPQALAQQRARHQRYAAVDRVEVGGAGQQFPDHQRRPSFGKHLRRLGDGAKLAVSSHEILLSRAKTYLLSAPSGFSAIGAIDQYGFWTSDRVEGM